LQSLFQQEHDQREEAHGLKLWHIASKAWPLATAALLITAGTAAADYSPTQLRTDSILELRALEQGHGVANGPLLVINDAPFELDSVPLPFTSVALPLRFDYPLTFAPGDMTLHLKAKPKLRRIVSFEIEF
jgi:hypothetical protein